MGTFLPIFVFRIIVKSRTITALGALTSIQNHVVHGHRIIGQ